MTEWIYNLLPIILVSGAISFTVTKIVIKLSKKLGIVDDPKKTILAKNTHEYPVPRGGGIPVFAAVAVCLVIYLRTDPRMIYILAAITILAIVGYMDDRWQDKVSPYFRLGVNVGVALLSVAAGISVRYLTNPAGGIFLLNPWLVIGLTTLWLTWMQNIVGWSSGVDGQLPGFVIIAAISAFLLANQTTVQNPIILLVLSGATSGAFLGFLFWNWFPQKIMPGYGGKSLAGYLLGIMAITTDVKLGTMAMVLGLPFIDAVFAIVKRLSEGRSPVWGGRDHLHHHLLDLGWSKRKVALFYWLGALVLSGIALQLKATARYFTMATVLLVTCGVILWLRNWSTYLKQPDRDSG